MVKDAKLDTWVQLYNQRCGPSQWGLGYWQMPDWMKDTPYPTLSPWVSQRHAEGRPVYHGAQPLLLEG